MEAKESKEEFINKLKDMGFDVFKMRGNKYLVNNKAKFSLFFSQVYIGRNITWYGLSERLLNINTNESNYFIVLIIDHPDNALIIPISEIEKIIKNTNLTSKNYYRIHVLIDKLVSQEGEIKLSQYLNNFTVFK